MYAGESTGKRGARAVVGHRVRMLRALRGAVAWVAVFSLALMYAVMARAENPTAAPCSPPRYNDVVEATTSTRFETEEKALAHARLKAKNEAADHCRENATVVPEACGDLWLKASVESRTETCDESRHGFRCTVSVAVWCVCTRCKAPPEPKVTKKEPEPSESPKPKPAEPPPPKPAEPAPRFESPPPLPAPPPFDTALRVEPRPASPDERGGSTPPAEPNNAAFDRWKADTAKQDAQARALAEALGNDSSGGSYALVAIAGVLVALPVVAAASGNRTAQNMVVGLTFMVGGVGMLAQTGMMGGGALATGRYQENRRMKPYAGALEHVLGPSTGFPLNLGISVYSSMGYGTRAHEGEVVVATTTGSDNEKVVSASLGAADGTAHMLVGRTTAQLTLLRLTLMGAFQMGGEHTLRATGETWNQTGFDLSGGFGVQPFHGGFLSPYLEMRVLQQNGDADTEGVTLPVDAACCIEPTRGPVNDSNPFQIVVGTTISFAPLFSTVNGRWERSLFLDAEAVVHLENPDTPGFVLTFGTESHLSF